MISNDKILTLDEAAKLLKLSKPTIYRKVKTGEIPAQKIGRSWRFLERDILNLVTSEKERPSGNADILKTPLNLTEISRLCKKYYIGLCYLFGSYAAGTADRASDIDIGIAFLPNVDLEECWTLYAQIKDDFGKAAGGRELDLIFLQKVGPLVGEQAISGTCIYSISDFFRERYEDNVSRDAMDFRFFQKRFDQEMIEDIREGGFFAA